MRLNADGHDESQYLPRDTPAVNAYRAAQGGISWDGQSIKHLTWMPDKLHYKLTEEGKPYLDRDRLQTCEGLYRAVTGTRSALGISDLRIYVGEKSEGGEPKDIFFAVLRKLLPYQSNLCLWTVCDEYNRGNLPLAMQLISSIHNALDMAADVIKAL